MKNLIALVLLFGSTLVSGMRFVSETLTEKLISAVKKGSKEECADLITQGADVNAICINCNRALATAAFQGHKEVCEFLIEKGADVDGAESLGSTPLMRAANRGHKNICEILITHKANVHSVSFHGYTALMGASSKEICQLLIKNGSEIDARNSDGLTVLLIAAQSGYKEVCKVLIENGADVHAVDKDGFTALMFAAAGGYKEICEILLEHGADVNVVTLKGITALRWAAEQGRKEVCKLLLMNRLLRGSVGATSSEAKERLITAHVALKEGELPHDIKLIIISWLREDLSLLAGCRHGNIDCFQPILQRAVAHHILGFLLSEDGKKLLNEIHKIANKDVKDLFTIDEALNVFSGKLQELLHKSFKNDELGNALNV